MNDPRPAETLSQRRFGRVGIDVSQISLGTYHLTSDRRVPRREALEIVRAASRGGITLVDTAPMYGLGEAESLLGLAISGGLPSPLHVMGKIGRFEKSIVARLGSEAYNDPGLMRAQLEHSLTLLGLDKLPILLIHETDWEEWGFGADPRRSAAWSFVEQARSDGRIGAVGLSVRKPAVAASLASTGLFDAMLFVHYHNMVWQGHADQALDAAETTGMGIAIGAPFRQGLLADDSLELGARLRSERRESVPPGIVARIEQAQSIARGNGMNMVELGLRWLLSDRRVDTTVVGPRTVDELTQNLEFVRRGPLPEAVLEALQELKEIPVGAW